MRLDKSKTAVVFAIVLLMSSSALMIFPTNAQLASKGGEPTGAVNGSVPLPAGVTPDMTMTPTAYLSFRPNPVGINQIILVNMWCTDSPSQTRYFSGFKVTFTKPDGTTDVVTLNSYYGDGTGWFEYTVDQIGDWKLKFDFPGGYFPPGNYTTSAVQNPLSPSGGGIAATGVTEIYTRSLYYLPASTKEQTLIVQQNPVLSWPPSPLPTDYWTRPVSAMNREWAPILGDFPWLGPATGVNSYNWPADTSKYQVVQRGTGTFTPYVQAPNTAHVVWERLGAMSGMMGGDNGLVSGQSGGGTPTIIFEGRCYQTVTKVSQTGPGSQTYWQCYDLRTGAMYWERPVYSGETVPSAIEYSQGTPEIPGAEAAAESTTASLVAIGGDRLIKYDPFTGAVNTNVSIPTFAQSTYYMNGYVLSVQTINATAYQWRLINWTTIGTSTNFASRMASNVSFARNNIGMYQDFDAGLCYVNREVNAWDATGLNSGPSTPNIAYDNASGIRYGFRTLCYDLVTGQLLYNITVSYDPYPEDSPYNQVSNIADHGKFGILMRNGVFWVYDGRTGKLLYKTEQMDYPWDAPSFGAYACASAYGLFYHFGYSQVYAFNWTNGKIVWKYEAPAFSEYESPYTGLNGETVYSFGAGSAIADGKLYCCNSEHTPSQPITRGWGLHCINATTGELIWKIKTPMTPGGVADGYLTASSTDGYLYVFGKGKSATTVTAPDTVIPKGSGVVIKGTVVDLSPAQTNTPCVAKDSMTTQMEYLHMQQSISGLWGNETIVGVPVTLTALGSNGEVVDIGSVTTSGYYGTFELAWTPPAEGTYKIIASFAGDDSYGSSAASTAVSVGPAPATTTMPEIPTPVDNTMLLYGILAAVMMAIVLAIIAILVVLRKR